MKKCKIIIDGNVYITNATLPSCEIEETTNVDSSKLFSGKHKWNPISFDELNHDENSRRMYQQLNPNFYIFIIYGLNEVYKLSNAYIDLASNKIEFLSAKII